MLNLSLFTLCVSPVLFYLFQGKVKIHQRQFPFLTLDVLLDNKHNFMTKMMEVTGNALHPLRFEEILGVVEKYHPISGLSGIPPTLRYFSICNWTISSLCYA